MRPQLHHELTSRRAVVRARRPSPPCPPRPGTGTTAPLRLLLLFPGILPRLLILFLLLALFLSICFLSIIAFLLLLRYRLLLRLLLFCPLLQYHLLHSCPLLGLLLLLFHAAPLVAVHSREKLCQLSRVDLRLHLLSSIIGLSRNRCWWHRLVSLGSLKKNHYNTLNPKNPKP